jgi:hypothetical protein
LDRYYCINHFTYTGNSNKAKFTLS